MVFELLAQKIRIFKAYFKNDFDEDTLRNNMTLILELMDGEWRGGRQQRCSHVSCRVLTLPWHCEPLLRIGLLNFHGGFFRGIILPVAA